MKRRILFAFVGLNVVVSVVVTFAVATLISQSRPEPTPLALSPVVVVMTPTGPTPTPWIITVTPNPSEDPRAADIIGTAEAVYELTVGPEEEDDTPSGGEETEPPKETATLGPSDITATQAAEAGYQTHTVQSGEYPGLIASAYGVSLEDLLCQNRLREGDIIHVGDVLVIPGPEGCDYDAVEDEEDEEDKATPTEDPDQETATPTPLPTITLPPTAENAQVHITDVLSPGDITDEEVVLTNKGGLVDLEGWTLYDRDGNEFVFPSYRLFPDGSVTVRTREGSDTPIIRHWGLNKAVWGNEGDMATLADAAGNIQSVYVIGEPDGVPQESEISATDESDESDEEETEIVPDEDEEGPTETPEPLG